MVYNRNYNHTPSNLKEMGHFVAGVNSVDIVISIIIAWSIPVIVKLRSVVISTMWHSDSVDSYKLVQPPFNLRNSKCCSVSSLTLIEYSRDLQRL